MEVRRLTADDQPALAVFSCERYREPWTVIVQHSVREWVADLIERGEADGIGLWEGDVLCGVAVWTPAETVWSSRIIAVRNGMHRRRLGTRLKQEMLDRARAAGVSQVVAVVHRDNTGALKLNEHFDATIVPDPGDRNNHLMCTISLD